MARFHLLRMVVLKRNSLKGTPLTGIPKSMPTSSGARAKADPMQPIGPVNANQRASALVWRGDANHGAIVDLQKAWTESRTLLV
jgi:hypothetical protein